MSVNYVYPMHPEVISDKPGKCSKCGMDLKQAEQKKSMNKEDKQSMCCH